MGHRTLLKNERHWKIVTGCTEIGPGCDSCPAMPGNGFKDYDLEHPDSGIQMWPDRLRDPSNAKEDQLIFYTAMGSDLFHDGVSDQFIESAFEIMNFYSHHLFSLGTKRSDRLRYLAPSLDWSDNIEIFVTVASKSCKHRIDALRTVESNNKVISICPLIEDLGELDLTGIRAVGVVEEDWGPKRKIQKFWADSIERQCQEQSVQFQFGDAIISEGS